jgi:hypothetical protein
MATGRDGYLVERIDGVPLGEAISRIADLNRKGEYKGMRGAYALANEKEIKFYPDKGEKKREVEPDIVSPFA